MDRVFVDASLSQQLGNAGHPLDLCSPTGVVLGRFVPLFVPPHEDLCPYSSEQLEQMRTQEGSRPLAEFWAELGAK